MTNCKNCGMPLVGGVCEYCGTDYRDGITAWDINRGIISFPRDVEITNDSGLLTITHLDDGIEYTISGTAGVVRWNNKGISYGEIH